jgi:hypothetical protein
MGELIASCPLCHQEKLILRQNGPWCYGGCSLNRQEELLRECAAQGIRAPDPTDTLARPPGIARSRSARRRGRETLSQGGGSSGLPSAPAPRRRDVEDYEPAGPWGAEPPL